MMTCNNGTACDQIRLMFCRNTISLIQRKAPRIIFCQDASVLAKWVISCDIFRYQLVTGISWSSPISHCIYVIIGTSNGHYGISNHRRLNCFCNTFAKRTTTKTSGPRFNIKMISYQYRKSHCGDETILRPSYLHNGISYIGKMTSLYWIRALSSVEPQKRTSNATRISIWWPHH